MNDIKIILGQRVKSARGERRMTQEALADLSGFSQQYISGLERGMRNPTIDSLLLIANALDTPIEFFVMERVPADPVRAECC